LNETFYIKEGKVKRWAIFLVLVLVPAMVWAQDPQEREAAFNQISERFNDYMTAIKFQEWDNAYQYISSRTDKGTFVGKMRDYWSRPDAPKIIEFRIDKINFNDYSDQAEVCYTERMSVFNKRTGWTEIQSPGKYKWTKEGDGQWYRDYEK
jgi:hypothetical protein